MYELSNSTLPYSVKSLEQLSDIDIVQRKTLPFDISRDHLWDYKKYYENIQIKKTIFLDNYPSRNFLEWNLPDYLAYKKLCASEK
jgi:hypothetical protein